MHAPPPRQTRRASIDCGAGAHRIPLKSFLNAVSEKTENNTKQKMLVLTEEKYRQQPTERGKPQRIQQGRMTEEARNACVLFPCLFRPHVCSSIVANYCYWREATTKGYRESEIGKNNAYRHSCYNNRWSLPNKDCYE